MAKFKFELKQKVVVEGIKKEGNIIARIEHVDAPARYLVGINIDGNLTESWFPEKSLITEAEFIAKEKQAAEELAAIEKQSKTE